MRKSVLLIATLALSAVSFAQKKELKEIKRAIDRNNLSQAQELLEGVKSAALSDRKFSAEYYFLKGEIALRKAIAGKDVMNSLTEASTSLAEAKKAGGKISTEVENLKADVAKLAVDKGQAFYQKNDFKNAAIAFEQVYRFSPKDTLFLYNAAVSASQAKENDLALKYFLELKNLKYDGSEILYAAKNKETGLIEKSADKNTRDMKMKTGNYSDPTQERTPSKKAEIIQAIAYIYVAQGNKEEAIKAFEYARKHYPKNANLIMQEANVYYQLGDMNKFEALMKEATELQPDNADAQYNIGVMNLQQGKNEEARKYFQKALKIAPDNANAALNYAISYTNEGNALVEQMNALGNTAEDIKQYDELKNQKDNLFRKATDVLNDYIKNNAKKPNHDVLEQLKNIYMALNDMDNYKRIKTLLEKNK
ncbi:MULTISPECIES: tetratricopeptide repeat protein [unclassified Capnocytophaga]|jgi:Cytochrome c biogenesis factor|uniref:tetratricopeptide repeat protein n=1 Tax=unclassified Capnocytophaga TaxID=2640652 RepID=UPI000202F4C5|nr:MULTISPECIES: tetratricopeptide repeat protein [unclassified Capnocytophaga]EGD34295.1 tetratricopeptide TPR_2 repeat protein [Capnocytophaga sp. oral taxon 338 str. F0234]MEB3004730.1 tetratricopeptide repeat protein [Capnocytophaga sp. G2]